MWLSELALASEVHGIGVAGGLRCSSTSRVGWVVMRVGVRDPMGRIAMVQNATAGATFVSCEKYNAVRFKMNLCDRNLHNRPQSV